MRLTVAEMLTLSGKMTYTDFDDIVKITVVGRVKSRHRYSLKFFNRKKSMKLRKNTGTMVLVFVLFWAIGCTGQDTATLEPLFSWRGATGSNKSSIIDFIGRVTDPSNADFVPSPFPYRRF